MGQKYFLIISRGYQWRGYGRYETSPIRLPSVQVMITKFHQNTVKIQDFLLIANFRPSRKFRYQFRKVCSCFFFLIGFLLSVNFDIFNRELAPRFQSLLYSRRFRHFIKIYSILSKFCHGQESHGAKLAVQRIFSLVFTKISNFWESNVYKSIKKLTQSS